MDIEKSNNELFNDICKLVEEARNVVATSANRTMTLLYWKIGERINNDLLDGKRASYGEQIVSLLATQLQLTYGQKGFETRSIRRMMQFASLFKNFQIVSEMATQLTWSHFIELLPLKDELQREFYARFCLYERWSTKQLRAKIDGMMYERTAISEKPELIVRQELNKLSSEQSISPDLVFKSPYFLEFTGLKGMYSEKSLEDSLIISLEEFIMELGSGFTFVERQKRISLSMFTHLQKMRLIWS